MLGVAYEVSTFRTRLFRQTERILEAHTALPGKLHNSVEQALTNSSLENGNPVLLPSLLSPTSLLPLPLLHSTFPLICSLVFSS
jgi:hypothetical protein